MLAGMLAFRAASRGEGHFARNNSCCAPMHKKCIPCSWVNSPVFEFTCAFVCMCICLYVRVCDVVDGICLRCVSVDGMSVQVCDVVDGICAMDR
jgi:hypothetical protein